MHVKWPKTINYLIVILIIFHRIPWNLFIYSDVWGPAPNSVSGKRYYVSFIDDHSKFTWIYRFKSDVFQKFHEFQKLVERVFNRKIVTMQTYRGSEYQNLNSFFNHDGINHHISCLHSHQQDVAVERKHRHIVEVGLALLAHANSGKMPS